MTDHSASSDRGVSAALKLIDQALACLSGESSPRAANCATQARAAHAALRSVPSGADSPPAGESEALEDGQHVIPGGQDVSALLAAAERVVNQLPARDRNHLAACAAMAYLRSARRALVTP